MGEKGTTYNLPVFLEKFQFLVSPFVNKHTFLHGSPTVHENYSVKQGFGGKLLGAVSFLHDNNILWGKK